ncbi:hypothetical protein MPLB_1700041 [Mesorhizobium sp. ORS 3324]|nr:hypothetical protein MPLB_1700041 [Mesorhizobium sp. ORS 3324]
MSDERSAEDMRRRGGRVLLGVALAIEPDETRLDQAFEQARKTTQTDARLTIQDADRHFRHGVATVIAPTRSQAIAAAKALSDAMAVTFGDSGPGRLTTEARRVADPLPNRASATSLTAFAFGAPLAGLIALVLILRGWPDFAKDLPRGAGLLAGISAALAVAIVLLPAGRSWRCLGSASAAHRTSPA